ncbi:hypothetical protein EX30DRAFT_394009 [Ascodesmis nigricans]|uniref:Uncharacterized protein n=1 Tax=Ascodesmis nigricans TaxID=341454 RepID=A0A4S2N1E1_9PEZI|nr:hypothetical protein EX30DRAFT_394009 [Ascodesmis nigricans]
MKPARYIPPEIWDHITSFLWDEECHKPVPHRRPTALYNLCLTSRYLYGIAIRYLYGGFYAASDTITLFMRTIHLVPKYRVYLKRLMIGIDLGLDDPDHNINVNGPKLVRSIAREFGISWKSELGEQLQSSHWKIGLLIMIFYLAPNLESIWFPVKGPDDRPWSTIFNSWFSTVGAHKSSAPLALSSLRNIDYRCIGNMARRQPPLQEHDIEEYPYIPIIPPLLQLPNLKKLSLQAALMPHPHSYPADRFSSLEKLYIATSVWSAAGLEAMLKRTPKLKVLALDLYSHDVTSFNYSNRVEQLGKAVWVVRDTLEGLVLHSEKSEFSQAQEYWDYMCGFRKFKKLRALRVTSSCWRMPEPEGDEWDKKALKCRFFTESVKLFPASLESFSYKRSRLKEEFWMMQKDPGSGKWFKKKRNTDRWVHLDYETLASKS